MENEVKGGGWMFRSIVRREVERLKVEEEMDKFWDELEMTVGELNFKQTPQLHLALTKIWDMDTTACKLGIADEFEDKLKDMVYKRFKTAKWIAIYGRHPGYERTFETPLYDSGKEWGSG